MESTPNLSDLSNENILGCCGLSVSDSEEPFVCEAEQFVSLLRNVLSGLEREEIVINDSSLAPLFFLAALHQVPGSWHSPHTHELSDVLLQRIYTTYETDGIVSFLTTQPRGTSVISELFKPIQQLVSTKGWYASSTAKLVATWIQSQLPYPTLGTYLHLFFPVLLRLLDDLNVDNQVMGLKSVLYMTHNVTRADLLVYNRTEVLLGALEKFIYSNHSGVLSNYQPVMEQLLSLIEQTPNKSVSPLTLGLTHHDAYLSGMLSTIPLSYTIELKRDKMKMLSQTVVLFNSALLPHLHQLVKAIVFFLLLPDLPEETVRFEAMDLILFICEHCSQQIHVHLFPLSLALVKLVTQCSQYQHDKTAKSVTYKQLALQSITCFQQLYACEGCGGVLLGYLKAVCETQRGSEFVASILRKTITRLSIANSEDLSIRKDAI